MKSLEIKTASFGEWSQNIFYFKDARRSWSVRKYGNFWFHRSVNMKNNYHQTFVVVRLITYSC